METNNMIITNEEYAGLIEAYTKLEIVKQIIKAENYPRETLATVLGINLDEKGAE